MNGKFEKPFGSVGGPADQAFSPVAPPESGWRPPVPGAVDPASAFPDPLGPYQDQPDQIMAMDLVVNQALNTRVLALKAAGEDLLIYRQKRFGETCACVDPVTNQAQDGCRICWNTRFVGGYDFMGRSVGTIGPNPMARKLTELGITLEQKPMLTLMPNFPLRDRDFVVSLSRAPVTDCVRFQAEPVIRGALDPNVDPLLKLNARKVLKISRTRDGSTLSVPNPAPISTPDNGYDVPPQVGGGEDFVDGVDYILTGGELAVADALTPPPDPDSRVLRVLGKVAPLDPPAHDDLLGVTQPKVTLYADAGFAPGLTVSVFCQAAKRKRVTATLRKGTMADAGFFIVTLDGGYGSGISDQDKFPASGFIATIVGSGILWLPEGRRPQKSSTYYVSYEAAINATLRYQIGSVSPYRVQGVMIIQEANVELMDQTHPIYGVESIFDLGAPLDVQAGDLNRLRVLQGKESGLVTDPQNVNGTIFVNPKDFLG